MGVCAVKHRVDANQQRIVRALRQIGCEVVSTAAMGDGFPDLLVYRFANDRLVMLEIKNPEQPKGNQKLTPHQVAFHERWPVHVVTNEAEALQAVGVL